MICVRISSTWLSQYQNRIIDCGEIQLKTFLTFRHSYSWLYQNSQNVLRLNYAKDKHELPMSSIPSRILIRNGQFIKVKLSTTM